MKNKKWTLAKLNEALKINVKDYGGAIAVAALFKKMYGKLPVIGLSGVQAEYADAICDKLPDPVYKKGSKNAR
jgi:hypothetical protein